MAVLKEFKEFAMKGNMVDLAVGLIIGAAFTTVIKSLVDDLFMPLVGLAVGGYDLSMEMVVLRAGDPPPPYDTVEAATAAGAVTLNYGLFINNVISFLLAAWAMFFVVKAINKFKRETPPEPAAPPEELVLLQEIRDAIKSERA